MPLVLAFLWGAVVTIFWMVCGWHAHERIAVSNPPVEVHFADVCGDGVPQFGWWYTSQNAAPE